MRSTASSWSPSGSRSWCGSIPTTSAIPIRMEVSKTRRKEGSPDDKPEYETYQEEGDAQLHGAHLAAAQVPA